MLKSTFLSKKVPWDFQNCFNLDYNQLHNRFAQKCNQKF